MKDEIYEYSIASSILFGPGCISRVGQVIRDLGGSRVLIVTDKGIVNAGLTTRLAEILDEDKIPFILFDKVVPNPTIGNVEDGVNTLKGSQADVVVGFGGGSSLDCAKAIAAMAVNAGRIQDYRGKGLVPKRMLPMLAINTTAGTGSEITPWAVITDPSKKVKFGIGDQNILPHIAIDDPLLTLTLPAKVTAETGMDALTHAIEGFLGRYCNPLTDAAAKESIPLIGKYLRIAFADGSNLEARTMMLYAQLLAGMSFSNAGVGGVHAMAHQLGALYDTPHGLANAVLLPYVMEHNIIADVDKFVTIAELLGESTHGLSIREKADLSVKAVLSLNADLGIPRTLSGIGIQEESIPQLAEAAMVDLSTSLNPRRLTIEAYADIFRKAIRGPTGQ